MRSCPDVRFGVVDDEVGYDDWRAEGGAKRRGIGRGKEAGGIVRTILTRALALCRGCWVGFCSWGVIVSSSTSIMLAEEGEGAESI